MYSITARFNQIVFFTSWTLVILSILNQGTAYYFKTGKATVDLSILSADKFHHYKATYYNGGKTDWDQATFKFNLNADFEPVFNWNLKQLFLYINVHSHTNTNLQSDCVVYDIIIQRPDSPSEWNAASKLSLKNQRVEYPLRDSHKQLRNATLLFEVWIEIMPYVGYIRREKIGELPYNMPTEILVTEKGIEWQRELSQEHYLIRPKYLQIRRTVEIPNITQRTQLSSKRRKPVNSVLEYLPKYCEMQGFVESVNELNRSCDLKGINETLRLRKERLKFNKYIDRNGLRLKIITIIDYNIQQHNFEMKQMELSFGDINLNTAQFFNPEGNKLKVPQKQKKREHSLPTTDFIALLSKPAFPIAQRRATFYHNNLKLKQKTLDSTQENMNLIFKQINNKLQHSHSSCAVPKKYTSITQQKENFECRESRTNSRCSVVSQGGDRKRKIKVNDPYGLFAIRDNSQKTSTKSFINQKAQTKLVDKIFSQRSDSIQ